MCYDFTVQTTLGLGPHKFQKIIHEYNNLFLFEEETIEQLQTECLLLRSQLKDQTVIKNDNIKHNMNNTNTAQASGLNSTSMFIFVRGSKIKLRRLKIMNRLRSEQ